MPRKSNQNLDQKLPPSLPTPLLPWQNSLLEKLSTREEDIVHFIVGNDHADEKQALVRHAVGSGSCVEIPKRVCKQGGGPMVKFWKPHAARGVRSCILYAPYKGTGNKAWDIFYTISCWKKGTWYGPCADEMVGNDHPSMVVFTDAVPKFDSSKEGKWLLWRINAESNELEQFHDNWREKRAEYWEKKRAAEYEKALKRCQRRWSPYVRRPRT
jgi:hypothetical protein